MHAGDIEFGGRINRKKLRVRPANRAPAKHLASLQSFPRINWNLLAVEIDHQLYRSIRQQPFPRVRRRRLLQTPNHLDKSIQWRRRLVMVGPHDSAAGVLTVSPFGPVVAYFLIGSARCRLTPRLVRTPLPSAGSEHGVGD